MHQALLLGMDKQTLPPWHSRSKGCHHIIKMQQKRVLGKGEPVSRRAEAESIMGCSKEKRFIWFWQDVYGRNLGNSIIG